MIKNKKHTMKGGRIRVFDFDNKNKNKDSVPKKYIYFTLNIPDKGDKLFKISPHTFAHFDEFTNEDLQNQILKFTHIMQYFVLFIFLLNLMNLTQDDFNNLEICKSKRLQHTCYINKEGFTIYIDTPTTKDKKSNEIYITSLFENNKNTKNTQTKA